jgi:8-oxo-dGTP diphosphatase
MPITGRESAVRVVAGILRHGEHIFVTRRASHSHQGGKWEFPGGKMDPGETALAALKRELREETGIDVQDAQPFLQIQHRYSDKTVLLDVWQVERWHGQPDGHEGQEARWAAVHDLTPTEFPAADRLILRTLQLPPLYLISAAARYGQSGFRARLERALQAGVRLVQLREPQMPPEEFQDYARELAGLCHRHGARLLLNADPDWVMACGADGVHLNRRRLLALKQRPLSLDHWVAASCHDAAELAQAQRIEADFAVLSPVARTESHPEIVPLGWERFQELCATVPLPVYALGGMQVSDRLRARVAGAQGLAMMRGVWEGEIEPVVAALTVVQDGRAAASAR